MKDFIVPKLETPVSMHNSKTAEETIHPVLIVPAIIAIEVWVATGA